jgi:FkbM family methyltransferase
MWQRPIQSGESMTEANVTHEANWRALAEEFYCVDAGSRGGFHDMRLLHPLIHMYSVDADTSLDPSDQKFASFHHFPLALYSSEGEMDLFVAARPGMSSLLEFDADSFTRHFGLMPGSESWRHGLTPIRRQKTKVRKADSLFKSQHLTRIDFLKLDTQGTELDILRGAHEYLSTGRISVIKTEVSFLPVYKSQCTFSEIDQFLKSHGFLFVDCMFYPDAVHAPTSAKAIHDVNLKEQSRFSAGGDAVYALHPDNYANDRIGSTIRSAILLNQMGYVSFAFDLLRGCGYPSISAENLLRATTVSRDSKARLRGMLKSQLPPWAYRKVRTLRWTLFAK